ncbi:ABC transporter ATP-binding protein [Desemzia sp. RIT804]|uniref:ABC transporter ATP-binding protein n=1 Tax=Desemzia sp. RIT 804 TaxID=2810209 RepID=UPI001950ADF4|nr:ABC transporter ATP-binding protein [Desemzia sp. RIT 804]MBM6615738.1 ABC transporter ATP-binding protein [Desemzia sp. RIT 804]
MKFIWQYLRKYPKLLAINVIGALGFILINLGLPTLLAQMIDNAIIPGNSSLIWQYAFFMLLLTIFGFAGRIVNSYASSKVVSTMTMDIRNDVYTSMMKFSHAEYNEIGVSSLGTRITTDAFVLLQFTEMILRLGVVTPLMLIVSGVLIVQTSPTLALAVLPAIPFIVLLIVLIARATQPLSKKQQSLLDNINRILRESLTGLRVIRAFNREEFQEDRFNDTNNDYRKVSSRLFKLVALTQPGFSLIINVVIIVIVWLGAQQIAAGNVQVGVLVAFIEYAFHALFSLLMFANIFIMYPRASVSANRLKEVLEKQSSIDPNEHGVLATETEGYITFDNVGFAYPDADKPVLKNISFESKPGETVAFIGSTGSGKSSIVQLIPRFYDVTEGRILVDGVDIRDYNLKALRRKIGFTPQKALLFTGTITENLKYGNWDASRSEIEEASEVSQSKEFIERLKNHYETVLSEGGSNLSGGQKQRLSIARSIIRKPSIYVFDDSFSALDFKTDAILRNELSQVTQNATTIVVGQRVSSIMNADQIILLDEGEIVAKGTHKELLQTSPLYHEIASSQLSEEELNQ